MGVKIKSTKDIGTGGAKIVIYGDSGIGKTRLLKDLRDVFIVSSEKGLLSLDEYDIPYTEVGSLSSLQEAYRYCLKCEHECIAIDSITEIAETVLFAFKKEKTGTGALRDPRDAYGKMADDIGALIRNFRDIPNKTIIMNAKEKPIYDSLDNISGYTAMMPGRVLPHGLPYLVDEVFAFQIDKKDTPFLQTKGDRKRPAKDRSGKLLPIENNPNLQEIIDRILKPRGEIDG